ncbi:ankyrin repeat and SOCS box protein 13a.1 isoform X1 [Tachysurus fulvidraco]|uniref:ankyrin repeat and SOCS box protein 13a.1 isoform X1 n=1 Tax=Tachysurus fulvidraco TaxID=1234273 RepID=UPI001FEEFF22|nr:ankyrin repeat and SOCS box protein 13a.1 isoform X1 [Tachysurus fulvidraco]
MDSSAVRTSLAEFGFWSEQTPVHKAASIGQAEKLQLLVDGGASVNAATADNITPLHDACIQDHPECVQVLLNAGAQVDVRTIHGSTPLCHACAAGSVESVRLLLDHGASVNPSLTALTASPLHEACIRGNQECVKLIISKGALLEAFDIHFGTPLHTACAKAHLECALQLLNAGARVNATKFHETALHHAGRVGREDLIELLVEFGGDVNVRDNLGRKPIDYTSPGSTSHICLQHYESCPLSLQQLCRITLRRVLGTRALQVITKLDISRRIISYLCYEKYS